MHAERAAEIINSPNTIEVLYNNMPIWIDSVDESRQTASIRLMETGSRIEVPVHDLDETGGEYGF